MGRWHTVRARGLIALVLRNKGAIAAGSFVVLLLAVSLVPSLFSPAGPNEQNLEARLSPPLTGSHLLGTDGLGRDILSRIIYGARLSLFISFGATAVAMAIGVTLGAVAGFVGGFVDNLIMRVVDIQMGFSSLLLILVLVVMIGPGVWTIVVVFGLGTWVVHARVVRASVLSIREMSFVTAARSIGTPNATIVYRHILPHVLPTIAGLAVLEMARLMVAEASISFLGYGVQPPDITWGLLIAQGQDYLDTSWWVGTFPGVAIIATVLCTHVLGEWLQSRYGRRVEFQSDEPKAVGSLHDIEGK